MKIITNLITKYSPPCKLRDMDTFGFYFGAGARKQQQETRRQKETVGVVFGLLSSKVVVVAMFAIHLLRVLALFSTLTSRLLYCSSNKKRSRIVKVVVAVSVGCCRRRCSALS
jgi:hypothetical protein